jgi:hypothetical protein
MWNHAPEMWTEMGDHQLAWPRFEPLELADLMTFLSQLGQGDQGEN